MRNRSGGSWLLGGVLALAGAGACASVPETPLFRRLGTTEGLPSNHVYSLAQDRVGHLWIGTGDGLVRYDGTGFQVWQHDPDDPASLPANNVQSLHVDAQDRLWLGTEGGGLSLMRPDVRGFRNFNARTDPRFALDDVWVIDSDATGAVWFGGFGGGLYRFDLGRDAVEVFRHDPARAGSLPTDHVLALAHDASGALWVGGDGGAVQREGTGFSPLPQEAQATPIGVVFSLTPEAGTLWVGASVGLQRRQADGRALSVAPQGASLPRVTAMLRDRRGTRWLATRSGVLQWSGEGTSRESLRTWLPGRVISDLLEDHEGGLWVATVGDGLQRLPPRWRDFAALVQGDAAAGGLGVASVRGLAESADGALWVTGVGWTLDRVNPEGRVERHGFDLPEVLDQQLWSLLEAADGTLWIGRHRGLERYDPRTGASRRWPIDAASDAAPAAPIDLMVAGPDGSLWLSANGVGLQHRAADGRVLADYRPGEASGIEVGDTEDMQLGPDGALWIAGDGGLRRLVPGSSRFERVPGSPSQRVYGFDFAPEGVLWLQRLGALEQHRVSAEGLTLVERVGKAQGLPAVEAGGLRVAAGGEVFLTTARGLYRYRPGSGEVRGYGVRDGLPTPEFQNRPPLKLRDGSIAAGTVAGLVWFDPARLERAPVAPRLRLESARVRRAGATLALATTQPLALRHDDRELHVGARLLSFADPQSHRYRFRLRGYEADWVDAGAGGERVFSQLPPGSYELLAVAANADGVWSAPPLRLAIDVAAPWWWTPWAWLAYAFALLLAFAFAALLYRRRLQRRLSARLRREKHAWTQRASEAKSHFLATLGHEIRTPMTGVLGMTELLLRTPLPPRERGYAEAIRGSGELLLKLVNDALDLARIEAGRLELADEPVDLRALLQQVMELQRPLAQRKELAFDLAIDADAPTQVRADPLRLTQILLNLVGNAIKFTERGAVRVALDAAPAPHTLRIVVSDTGPGFDAAQRDRLFQRFVQAEGAQTARRHGGSGLGLAICQELAVAMGGRIDVTSEPGRGSSFAVLLPLAVVQGGAAVGEEVSRAAVAATGAAAAPRRILLVEDDATVAAVVTGLLELQGHAVTLAAHALAALAALETSNFDLAFVDLDLPGVDGLALARLIVARSSSPPLVALTARTDAQAEALARAAGMVGFLRKPVSGAQLAQAIERIEREPAATPA